jgi:hypothetical protein
MFIQIGDLFAVKGLTVAAFHLKNNTNDRAPGHAGMLRQPAQFAPWESIDVRYRP